MQSYLRSLITNKMHVRNLLPPAPLPANARFFFFLSFRLCVCLFSLGVYICLVLNKRAPVLISVETGREKVSNGVYR